MKDGIPDDIGRLFSWKREYGNVYFVRVGKEAYVYRALSRSDHALLIRAQGYLKFDLEDAVLKECLLEPRFNKDEFDNKLAGEVEDLVKKISESSGFSEMERVEKDLENNRSSLGSLENQIVILICKAFPHLTLEDIDNFTYDELVRHLVIAEAILDVKLNIEKPKPQNQGTVNFDEENKVMGAVPFDKNLNIPRGDVRK
jgi:hypothetical protein